MTEKTEIGDNLNECDEIKWHQNAPRSPKDRLKNPGSYMHLL